MSPASVPLTGHCLCGAVTYRADAEPVVQAVCHLYRHLACSWFPAVGQVFVWAMGAPLETESLAIGPCVAMMTR